MSTVRHSPGEGVAVVGQQAFALLKVPGHSPLPDALAPSIADGRNVLDILEVLGTSGVVPLPDFVLVAPGAAGLHAIIRGEGRLQLRDGVVSSPGQAGWCEVVLSAGVRELSMFLASAGDDEAEESSPAGIVKAGRLTVSFAPAQPIAVPAALHSVETEHTLTFATSELEGNATEEATPEPAPLPAPTELVPEQPEAPSYDFLFEATIQRPAELLEPERATPPEIPVAAPPPQAATAPVAAAPAPAPSPTPVQGTSLISAVPWEIPAKVQTPPPAADPAPAVITATAAAAPPQVQSVPNEEDERTLRRDEIVALQQAQPAVSAGSGPFVHAIACAAGHLNDPQSDRCRSCREPLGHQDAVTVPRPVLGLLRLSTGETVTLDRGVLLGRGPSAETQGSDRPHLVKVNNPNSDISRNHVGVQLDGWHVLVRDLGSKNGTVVTLPGQVPQMLRAQVPVPIVPGTKVALADDLSFVFEAAE